jgi:phosphoadenosine phosphosulfate reductase
MSTTLGHFPPTDKVLIAYSGGKDSLVMLDLAVKAGLQVEAFHMYFLPDMDYSQHWCDFARKRWGITVREYLHWDTIELLREGVFRAEALKMRRVTIGDIEARVRKDSGFEWIGWGLKSVDSLERRGMIFSWPNGVCNTARGKVFTPIKNWNHKDVKAYLTRNGIPIPKTDDESGNRTGNGISLDPSCMHWIRREWPEDYKRILKVFPFASAQADRHEAFLAIKQQERAAKKQIAQAAKAARLAGNRGNETSKV